jgi:hypothetical protein
MAVPKPRKSGRNLERLDAVAERLDVHPRTLRRRIADGTIHGYTLAGRGRVLFLDRDEIDAKLFHRVPTVERSA